jgi:Bacteriocin class II with double-glycine leader peptide
LILSEEKTMEAQARTRRDLGTALIEKCWKDPEFKKAVLSDPKGMLEQHLGQKLPRQLRILIHDEDANTLHFTLPPAPSNLTELSDEDLERVAGGTDVAVTIALAVIGAVTGAASAATASVAVATPTKAW